MERREGVRGSQEVQRVAKALLQQSERLALAGLREQAAEILAQVWAVTQECEPKYANAASCGATGSLAGATKRYRSTDAVRQFLRTIWASKR